MKALAIAALLLVGVTACDDSDAVSTSDASTTSTASSVTSTSDTSDTTDDTSASSTSVVAMSTSTSMLTETTSTTAGSTTSTKGASTAKPETTASSAASGASGLVLSDKGVGVANFGVSRAQAESALAKLVGPVDDVDTSATCWGEMVVLSWDNGLSVQFLRDELYNWSLTSDELGGPKGVSVGDPATDLSAAYSNFRASSFDNELSGDPEMILQDDTDVIWFRAQLTDLPQDDPEATIVTLEGQWGAEFDRLFTVVDERPDVYCGD